MTLELRRIYSEYINKKPKLVIGKNMPVYNKLNLGDKGQLDVLMNVSSIDMVMDGAGSEVKEVYLIINKADVIENVERGRVN